MPSSCPGLTQDFLLKLPKQDSKIVATMSITNKCWAKSISACSDKMSQEHIISKCLFDEEVIIKGFDWCKDKEIKIGLGRFTSKCLCTKHNHELSSLDEYAGNIWDNLGNFFTIRNKRESLIKSGQVLQLYNFTIDARLMERWILKCLCNLLFVNKEHVIPENLVKIIFGVSKIPKNVGAGVVVAKGESLHFIKREKIFFSISIWVT